MEMLERIVTIGAKIGIGFFELTALGVMVWAACCPWSSA